MKIKFLVPVMAMIFAVGMSFANAEKDSDPLTDYILVNGNFEPIEMEITCEPGILTCRVQLEPNGEIYEVYGAANSGSKKPGTGTVYRPWE